MAQLFSLGSINTHHKYEHQVSTNHSSRIFVVSTFARRQDRRHREFDLEQESLGHFAVCHPWIFAFFVISQTQELDMTMLPNKSPEPTAVGAVSSAVAVHAANRRWLSFFR